ASTRCSTLPRGCRRSILTSSFGWRAKGKCGRRWRRQPASAGWKAASDCSAPSPTCRASSVGWTWRSCHRGRRACPTRSSNTWRRDGRSSPPAGGRPRERWRVGAAPELIEDGVHGLLVPPGDAGRLADAIDRLLRRPEWARRLADAARRRARERYGREAMVERFTDFYERLAAKKRRVQ